MEKEGNTITRQNVKIICDAFNVNEHWLRTGEGDMFKPVDEPNILDRLQRELNLNNAEMEIIKTFIELSPEILANIGKFLDICLLAVGHGLTLQ